MGSPSAILTLGLGSWGSSSLVVTLGYGVGEEAVVGHLCGDVTLLSNRNAKVGTYPSRNASVQLLPTYAGIVKAREC